MASTHREGRIGAALLFASTNACSLVGGLDGDFTQQSGPSSGSGYCETRSPMPVFCADFDAVAHVQDGAWSGEFINPPASVTLDATTSSSPKQSMRSALSGAVSMCTYAQLAYVAQGVFKTFTFGESVKFPAGSLASSSGGLQPAAATYGGTDLKACTILPIFFGNQTIMLELQSPGGGEDQLTFPGVADDGAWKRFDVEVDVTAVPVSFRVTSSDGPGGTVKSVGASSAWQTECASAMTSGGVAFRAGLYCISHEVAINVDDATFDGTE